MIEIPLTQGQVALIDDEDFDLVSQYKWYAHYNSSTKSFYATTNINKDNGKHTSIMMHRIIMNAPKELVVDHIDHDTLNNKKLNLRLCSQSENLINTGKHSSNTSGYKGVSYFKRTNKWLAQIRINGKVTYLGYFDSPEKAYNEYCKAAKMYYREFANLG